MDLRGIIGSRIRRFRKARGMTQKVLAQTVGMAAGSISDFERGKVLPRVYALDQIARALGVSADDFLDLDQKGKNAARVEAESRAVALLRSLPDEAMDLAADQIAALVDTFSGRRE